MANNTGFLLIAGLGALFFLGRGGAAKGTAEDNRMVPAQGRGAPPPPTGPAFDLQSYIDGLFGEMASVPVQPDMGFFYPPSVVVTSSGVPGISIAAPEIITATTKVQIGGDGGETITASALAVRRSEQIAQQKFEAAANVFAPPPGETADRNRIEEERMRKFARDLIAQNIAAQLKRNQAVVARTREDQERLSTVKVAPHQPTINFDEDDDQWSMDPFAVTGQSITVPGIPDEIDVDFTPQYSETFVISGGMASAGFASEDEQPYQPVTTVHEITAAYDIGF